MSEMVERVTKAIALAYRERPDPSLGAPAAAAIAAIEAMREPTEAMIEAGIPEASYDSRIAGPEDVPAPVWQAMIDAALTTSGA